MGTAPYDRSTGIIIARIKSTMMMPDTILCVFRLRIWNMIFLLPYRIKRNYHFCLKGLYMKTLFLSSFIIVGLLLFRLVKKQRRTNEQFDKEFWEREALANNTRKKPLDGLKYISIPFDRLPLDLMTEDPVVAECLRLLESLSAQKIVNLTGYTNTDLKLEYGTANITVLTEYDQNYTLLVRTLQQWAEALFLKGYVNETRAILEFAISTNTDVSHSYYLLADIYDDLGLSSLKSGLIETASQLNAATKNIIVRTLQGSGPYSGWLHSV